MESGFPKLPITKTKQHFAPLFHAALDLDGLVAAVDDSDVHLPGVRLLLPQEVVDAGLDVGPQSRRGQVLRQVRVRPPLRVAPLVAIITDIPAMEDGRIHLRNSCHRIVVVIVQYIAGWYDVSRKPYVNCYLSIGTS